MRSFARFEYILMGTGTLLFLYLNSQVYKIVWKLFLLLYIEKTCALFSKIYWAVEAVFVLFSVVFLFLYSQIQFALESRWPRTFLMYKLKETLKFFNWGWPWTTNNSPYRRIQQTHRPRRAREPQTPKPQYNEITNNLMNKINLSI